MSLVCVKGGRECREEWRDIPGYEGLYEVSCCGQIRNAKTLMVLKPVPYRGGYLQVSLYGKGKMKKMKVHRAVGMAFLDNHENKPQINHRDENKTNNCVFNLEWVTAYENVHYGSCIERGKLMQGRRIIQKTLDGKIVFIWPYSTALRNAGFLRCEVWKCCTGRKATYKGFIWEYEESEV